MAFWSTRTVENVAGAGEDTANAVDLRLVAATRADPHAFGPLYERHYSRIYRYCYTRLGSREAAEDVAADVFLRAFANLERFRGGVFAAWLYTLARHAVADHFAAHRATAPLDSAEERVAGAAGPHLDRLALQSALARLPEEAQAVLELQLSGWSGAEIAAALGKSVAAVKMIRYRALERLQSLLAEER